VLEVAQHRIEHHWLPLTTLAILSCRKDKSNNKHRGYLVVSLASPSVSASTSGSAGPIVTVDAAATSAASVDDTETKSAVLPTNETQTDSVPGIVQERVSVPAPSASVAASDVRWMSTSQCSCGMASAGSNSQTKRPLELSLRRADEDYCGNRKSLRALTGY